MLITALMMTAALGAAPFPNGDPDSVVTTAPATTVVLDAIAESSVAPAAGAQAVTPHGLNTDQQIAQWLTARAPAGTTYEDQPQWRDDRKPHGEVSVGVGTGGYRDYAAAMSLPIGERGRLDISIRQTENGYPYRYGYGDGYDGDLYYGDSGYVFPGVSKSGAAAEYESRLTRPGGPPGLRREPRPEQPAP